MENKYFEIKAELIQHDNRVEVTGIIDGSNKALMYGLGRLFMGAERVLEIFEAAIYAESLKPNIRIAEHCPACSLDIKHNDEGVSFQQKGKREDIVMMLSLLMIKEEAFYKLVHEAVDTFKVFNRFKKIFPSKEAMPEIKKKLDKLRDDIKDDFKTLSDEQITELFQGIQRGENSLDILERMGISKSIIETLKKIKDEIIAPERNRQEMENLIDEFKEGKKTKSD